MPPKNREPAPNPFDPRENPNYEYVPPFEDEAILWRMRQPDDIAKALKKVLYEWDDARAAAADIYDVQAIVLANEKKAVVDKFLMENGINRTIREKPSP